MAKKDMTDKVFINVFDLNFVLQFFALGKLSRHYESRKRTIAKQKTYLCSIGTE
jgi:hypothetical protein